MHYTILLPTNSALIPQNCIQIFNKIMFELQCKLIPTNLNINPLRHKRKIVEQLFSVLSLIVNNNLTFEGRRQNRQ